MGDVGLFLSAAALGFVLGMRHATDADHVVAISTIVSRQRTFAAAGLIGALWGIGHTLTVTVVGLLIIVFGLVISPPLALALELLVGLMLIVLGVLTLTGTMGRLVDRFGLPHEHPHAHDGGAHTHAHDLAHELEDLAGAAGTAIPEGSSGPPPGVVADETAPPSRPARSLASGPSTSSGRSPSGSSTGWPGAPRSPCWSSPASPTRSGSSSTWPSSTSA